MSKKISIVVPMHNSEKTIEKCLTSILTQTYSDLEIILIDDFSSDSTVTVANKMIQNDRRARVIRYEENISAFVMRNRGIREATGTYILFVDSDDYISNGLCMELVQKMESEKCDILHFNAQIINCGISEKTCKSMQEFVYPYTGRIFNEDVFTYCFLTEQYGFNLWNKFFSARLCKDVVSKLEDKNIPKANDLALYFFLALEAREYVGFNGNERYYYCYGKGSTGKAENTIEDFKYYCSYKDTIAYMEAVIQKSYGSKKAVSLAISKIRKRLILECVSVWHESVSANNQNTAFELMCKSWDGAELTNAFWYLFNGKEIDIANRICSSQAMDKISRSKIRKIAIYYHRLCKGGVERVISLLIPIYCAMGYSVILITDEEASDEDFYISSKIRRYVIPSARSVRLKEIEYMERGSRLQEILLQEQVDVLSYQAATSPILFYDLLVSKLNHVEFVLTKHELFSQGMVRILNRMCYENAVYPLADKMTVLSECEQLYWRTMGVDAYYIPNPKSDFKLQRNTSNKEEYIVWVGRLDKYQKRHQDIVPVIAIVRERFPDVKVKIFGSAETYEDVYCLNKDIKDMGLEGKIEYCGYTTDLEEIYSGAIIHFVTSAYESFPMGIFESHEAGIPLVTYDMPYLEMLKDDGGSICVEPLNYKMMADALVLLLKNPELRAKMGQLAKQTAQRYENAVIGREWKRLFSENKTENKSSIGPVGEYQTILKTIAYHYSLGWEEMDICRRKMNRLQKEKWVNEIKLKMLELNAEVVLYPFGDVGRRTKELLNTYGIEEAFAVDNKLSKEHEDILSLDDLRGIDCSKYLFAVCSDRISIYHEIRDALMEIVPVRNVYDLFPLEDGE